MSALAETLIVVGLVGAGVVAVCAAVVFVASVLDLMSRMRRGRKTP